MRNGTSTDPASDLSIRKMIKETSSSYQTQEEIILDILDKKYYIIRKDIENVLGISQARANRIIKEMVNSHILHKIGQGKNIKYTRK